MSDSEDFFGNAAKKLKVLFSKSNEKEEKHCEVLISNSVEMNTTINGEDTSKSLSNVITLSDDSDDNLLVKPKRKSSNNDSDTEYCPSNYQSTMRQQRYRKSKRLSLKNDVSHKPVQVTKGSDLNTNNSHLKAVRTNNKRKKKTQPSENDYSQSQLQRFQNYGSNGNQNSIDTYISNNLSRSIALASPDKGSFKSLRGRGKRKANKNVSQSVALVSPDRGITRRVRGQGNRGRGRKRPQSTTQYPTYNIGNTAEYPDKSEEIALFSSKPNIANEIVISDEDLDENEELSVNVYWQNFKVFKFNIRRFQKLRQIFDFFAKKENVPETRLFFAYNDVVLTCDDTPDSIKYNIAKFIEGGLISQEFTNLVKEPTTNKPSGIEIKFQCQNFKKPYEISVQPNDKLSLVMVKCAEHFEKPLNNLRFEFDGESISGTTTAKILELESGDCIDVRII